MKLLDPLNFDLTVPTTLVLKNNQGKELLVEVFESEIYFTSGNDCWSVVEDSKKELESVISPSNKTVKYIRAILKEMFFRIYKLL